MKKKIILKNSILERFIGVLTIISLVMLMGVLSGCTGLNNTFDWKKPVALDIDPPEGPYKYRLGWSDGCKSGLASTNTSFHQTFGSYKFTLDEKLRYNPLYNKAWQYGYNHCGYSMKSLAQYSF